MSYEVFARKYRPKVFDDLVGQEAIAQALRYAVAQGRTANVYIFAGSHGVGKTSVARILAKALDCPNVKDGAPCGTCETCESIARGENLDVIEIDAASNNRVDDVRALRESVGYKPAGSKFKVYILDEFHRITKDAFDVLLKTFEEGPPHVRFVLATTELHKVPTTILSRAQVFRFQRAGLDALVRRLGAICAAEKLSVEDAALRAIARRARGSIRDSQKLLDQVAALAVAANGSKAITADDVAFLLGDASWDVIARCLQGMEQGRPGELLGQVHEFIRQGGRADALATDLLEALRGALYLKTAGASSPLLDDVALSPEDLKPLADALSEEGILYALQILQDAQIKMRDAREPRLVLELSLVRLARARELRPVGEVLARLERLERALGGSPGARGPAPSGPGSRAPSSGAPGPAPAAAPLARDAGRTAETAAPRGAEPRPGGPAPRARSGYDYPAEFTPPAYAPAPASGPSFGAGGSSGPAFGALASAGTAVALADPPRVATLAEPLRGGAPTSAPSLPNAAFVPVASATPTPAFGSAPAAPPSAPGLASPAPALAPPSAPTAAAPAPSPVLEPFLQAWDKVRAAASTRSVLFGRAFDRSRPLSFVNNVLTVEVRSSEMVWGPLVDQLARATEVVREGVGMPGIELRLERARETAPTEAPAAPVPAGPGPASGPAPAARGRSIYDEPIVQVTQRILGSIQMGGGW